MLDKDKNKVPKKRLETDTGDCNIFSDPSLYLTVKLDWTLFGLAVGEGSTKIQTVAINGLCRFFATPERGSE